MKTAAEMSLLNARPHPTPLPRGEGESFAASLVNLLLDLREVIAKCRAYSQAIPSPGGEGQSEGGCRTIQSEPPYVSCYKSR